MAYTFGSVFSDAWIFYKKNFWNLFAFTAFIFIISALYQVLIMQKTLDIISASASTITFTEMMNLFGGLWPWMILSAIIGILYASCLIYFIKSNRGIGEAVTNGIKYSGKLILLSIIQGIFILGLCALFLLPIGLGIMLNFYWLFILSIPLIIPVIMASVYWYFSNYCLIYEKSRAYDALGKSFRLVKGRWWQVLGYSILLSLIFMAIMIAFSLIIGMIFPAQTYSFTDAANPVITNEINNSIQVILTQLISAFVSVFSVVFFAHFYFVLKKSPEIIAANPVKTVIKKKNK